MSPKAHPAPLTGTELLAFIAEPVAYEIESIGSALAVAARAAPDQPERRAGVESFLLHIRNLHWFFAAAAQARRYERDVLAVDAAPSWLPRAILPEGELHEVNAMLAHLSVGRVELVGRSLPLQTYAASTVAVAESWMAELPPGTASRRLQTVVAYAKRVLDSAQSQPPRGELKSGHSYTTSDTVMWLRVISSEEFATVGGTRTRTRSRIGERDPQPVPQRDEHDSDLRTRVPPAPPGSA